MLAWRLGSGEAVIVDRIVARVNGDIITLSELKASVAGILANMKEKLQEEEDPDQKILEIEKQVLQKLIENRLIVYHAKHIGVTVTDEEIAKTIEDIKKQASMNDLQFNLQLKKEGMTMEGYQENIKEQILVSRAFQLNVRSKLDVNEEDIKLYYQKNKENYFVPGSVKLRQILFLCSDDADPMEKDRVKAQADYVQNKLLEGEDFAELAKKYSQDPSAGKGGNIGYFKRGQLLPVLEEVSFDLEEGETSPAIQSQFGFHILKVEEKKETSFKPFSDVKTEIREQLLGKKGTQLQEEWIKRLERESFVEKLYP
jgi:peptidyl-prolyl cis-trans isomerase SurA